jgi:hypothetical protein
MASLGSLVVPAVTGCADFEMAIPSLGPAAPPTPVPGMKYIRASEIGCALDCDIRSGRNPHTGGHATDDGPRINAALQAASESNPITLILDGTALVSGLFLPAGGYWSIAGLGSSTGFFIKSGANNDGLHNGPAAWLKDDFGPPAPALRGRSVSLSNFTINGNAGDGRSGDSTTGYPQGNLTTGQECYPINLMNLDDVRIENLVIVNSPCYHIRFANVGHATVTGCIIQSQGPNTDGIHIDGPANDIAISGCKLTTNDDAIALNCPEGYSGDIRRVSVTNCQFDSPVLMRLDTIAYPGVAQTFYIEDVDVSGCTGKFPRPCFEIGDGAHANPDAVKAFTISDCTLSAPALLNIWANFGDITLRNVRLIPSHDSQEDPGFSLARTNLHLLNPDSGQYVGSSFTVNNCVIERHSGSPAYLFVVQNQSLIRKLEIDGFSIEDHGDHDPSPEMLKFISGNIGQLVLNSVSTAHINAPVSPGGISNISSISGSGVLATGWEFPDPVMADNVPYISAATGRPSIKIDGVVYPYA